jgi:hypothetical protein
MPRFWPLVPRLAAGLFFAATATFFVLNPAAYKRLDALNVLQFNLHGVNFAFVMAVFAYALPGVLLTSYFSWHLVHLPTRFRVEVVLLLVASTLLLQLGVLSTSPAFPGRTQYLMLLTWLFPTLHGAALLRTAFTGPPNDRRWKFLYAGLGLYLLYRVPGNILFGSSDFQVNLPIVLCFAWYASATPFFNRLRSQAWLYASPFDKPVVGRG